MKNVNNVRQSPTDVMIDMEFLALDMRPVVLSIGAVAFHISDTFEILKKRETFYQELDMNSQPYRTIDAETWNWWQNQPDATKKILNPKKLNPPLKLTLEKLKDWYKSLPITPLRMWSHGAACDLAILTQAYYEESIALPWHYRTIRDTRTLFDWYPRQTQLSKILHHTKCGPLHHALYDAQRQALAVLKVWMYLHKEIHRP